MTNVLPTPAPTDELLDTTAANEVPAVTITGTNIDSGSMIADRDLVQKRDDDMIVATR